MQMPEQGSAPATAVNEGALYTKDVSGATQLFWRNENNGSEQQLTNPTVSSNATAGGTSYSIDTVFGLKIKWGNFLSGGFTASITFAGSAFANTNYSIIAVLQAPGASGETVVVQAGKTTTTVVLKTKDTSNDGYYIAIGV